MTICIAALYDDGAGVVLVSDRMVTAHIPIGYEFENSDTTKIVELDDAQSVYALIAGDVVRGNEVLNAAKLHLAQRDGIFTATEAADIVRSCYQQKRIECIVHKELEPRGLDINTYYGRQQQMSPQIVQMIDQALHSNDLGVNLLVAGSNGQTHTVHTILNPGTIHDSSSIGYGAIGSGAPHALYSLIADSFTSSMDRETVVGLVERAKERSEVAPGVGSETTTIIIPSEENNDA